MNTPETHFGDFVDPNRHSVLFKCVSGFGFRNSSFRLACSGIIAPVCAISGNGAANEANTPKISAGQKLSLLLLLLQVCVVAAYATDAPPVSGVASWYGEEHRGKLMANGRRFNPDKLTAASWFYPLGTKVCVSLAEGNRPARSVVVTITDRGPSKDLVRDGRIIDLTHAAFKRLAHPDLGLVAIHVELAPGGDAQVPNIAANTPKPMTPAPTTIPSKSNLEVCQVH